MKEQPKTYIQNTRTKRIKHDSYLGEVRDVVVFPTLLADVTDVHLDAVPDFGQGLQSTATALQLLDALPLLQNRKG